MTFALASSSPRNTHDHLAYTPTEQQTPTRQKRSIDEGCCSPTDRTSKRPLLDNHDHHSSAPHTPLREKHANQVTTSRRHQINDTSKLQVIPNSSPSGNHSPQQSDDIKRVLPLQRAFEPPSIHLRRKAKRHPDFRRVMLPDTPWKKPSTLESFAHVAGTHHTPIRQTSRLDAKIIITSDDEELENEEEIRQEEQEEDMVFTQPFALALRNPSDDHRPVQSTRRSLLNELLSSSGISQPSSELEPMYDNYDQEDDDVRDDDDETDDGGFGVEWPKDNPLLEQADDDHPESYLSNLRSSPPPPQPYRDSIWTSNGGLSSFTNEGDEDLDEVDVFFSSSRPHEDKSYDFNITGSSYATAWPHFLTHEYFEECKKNEGKDSKV